MAFANVSEEELSCSICLSVYQDPVMLRCGHNFCSSCIGDVLDAQEGSGYSCPQCRTEFAERPALHRNITLRNIAESLQPNIPKHKISGILCNYCINSSVPAVKTCVLCEASLCEGHVKVHNKAAEHVLIEPTTCLENRKCSVHKKILEYYCNEDSMCICVSCSLNGKHKGHHVEPINDAFENKRKKLRNDVEGFLLQNLQAKSRIQTLLDHQMKVKEGASSAKNTVTDLVRTIHQKLDALEKKIIDEFDQREDKISTRIAELIQHLVSEVDNISKKMMEVEKLCNMADPLDFLHEAEKDDYMKTVDHKGSVELGEVTEVSHLHEEMIVINLLKGLIHIVNETKMDTIVQTPAEVVFDEDTAGNHITVSKDLKTASCGDMEIYYPPNPRRFVLNQVLSKNTFSSGQHYWEVETGKTGNWRMGVAYSSIDRKGAVGSNNKSWVLRRCTEYCGVIYNDEEIHFPYTFSSQNFGLYLDYDAGRLSFYELCDPIRHLHTFTATFTEPLHAAFLLFATNAKLINIT
ncbi:E3 ubiquitin/ISG15 ligase TRIM25-like [Hyperolius riggenbachi]|uniref:E3 ubiquitin/ISG15 ligase TRIM25-like n=1 Tax=Hyperolius riggenbachi TaxID=752182 RepID=UPI0035A39DE6